MAGAFQTWKVQTAIQRLWEDAPAPISPSGRTRSGAQGPSSGSWPFGCSPQTGSQCPGARLGRDAPLLCPQGHTQGTCAAAMSPQWLFSPRKWGSVGCLLPMDTSGGMSNLQIPSDSWKRLPKSMCVQTHTHVHILRTPPFHCSWPVLLSYPDLSP